MSTGGKTVRFSLKREAGEAGRHAHPQTMSAAPMRLLPRYPVFVSRQPDLPLKSNGKRRTCGQSDERPASPHACRPSFVRIEGDGLNFGSSQDAGESVRHLGLRRSLVSCVWTVRSRRADQMTATHFVELLEGSNIIARQQRTKEGFRLTEGTYTDGDQLERVNQPRQQRNMPKDCNPYDLHRPTTRFSQCEQTTERRGRASRRRLRRSGPPSEELTVSLSTDDTYKVQARTRVALLGREGSGRRQPLSCM